MCIPRLPRPLAAGRGCPSTTPWSGEGREPGTAEWPRGQRSRLDRRKGAFDLGRFELPVAVGALVWTLVALLVLVAPREALVSVVIVVGLLLGGGLFFLILIAFNREALETEPGDVSASKH
ncbi:hypothetical protein [Streptomyces sp. NPDC059828]|uniref:hypothetical protein n=1 Tax=Streptomyces sp. NPDC059828 TaxID=3346965 RepID=UPI00364D8F4B